MANFSGRNKTRAEEEKEAETTMREKPPAHQEGSEAPNDALLHQNHSRIGQIGTTASMQHQAQEVCHHSTREMTINLLGHDIPFDSRTAAAILAMAAASSLFTILAILFWIYRRFRRNQRKQQELWKNDSQIILTRVRDAMLQLEEKDQEIDQWKQQLKKQEEMSAQILKTLQQESTEKYNVQQDEIRNLQATIDKLTAQQKDKDVRLEQVAEALNQSQHDLDCHFLEQKLQATQLSNIIVEREGRIEQLQRSNAAQECRIQELQNKIKADAVKAETIIKNVTSERDERFSILQQENDAIKTTVLDMLRSTQEKYDADKVLLRQELCKRDVQLARLQQDLWKSHSLVKQLVSQQTSNKNTASIPTATISNKEQKSCKSINIEASLSPSMRTLMTDIVNEKLDSSLGVKHPTGDSAGRRSITYQAAESILEDDAEYEEVKALETILISDNTQNDKKKKTNQGGSKRSMMPTRHTSVTLVCLIGLFVSSASAFLQSQPSTTRSTPSLLGTLNLPDWLSPPTSPTITSSSTENGLSPEYPYLFRGRLWFRPALVKLQDSNVEALENSGHISILNIGGYTLGGTVALEYDESPVGPYREYVSMGALVATTRGGGMVGQWGSRLYVSTKIAEEICQQVWTVPAEVDNIDFQEDCTGTRNQLQVLLAPDPLAVTSQRQSIQVQGWSRTRKSREDAPVRGGLPIWWTPSIKALWVRLLPTPLRAASDKSNELPVHKLRLSASSLSLQFCGQEPSELLGVPLGVGLSMDNVLIEIGVREGVI